MNDRAYVRHIRQLYDLGGFGQPDLLTADVIDRLLRICESDAALVEELADWFHGADHHPGCSGAFPPHRCKCGRDRLADLLTELSDTQHEEIAPSPE